MTLPLVLALLQAAGWRLSPDLPTVGDTVWVERVVAVDPGWVVRPAAWELAGAVEVIGPGTVGAVGSGLAVVRYPLVAWEPGRHRIEAPALWRLGPDGTADSVPGVSMVLVVGSVVPRDSAAPRAPRPPIARQPRSPIPLAAAILVATAVQAALWRWRRRRPRPPRAEEAWDARPARRDAVGDARIDATRIAARLRLAIAQREPAARRSLTTLECLAVLADRRPAWPLARLEATLRRLDAARFAPLTGHDLAVLAEEAAALEREL